METLLADLRFALRTLRHAPAYATAAIASIALGIGANALVFSWLDSLVLNPFPMVAEPHRLAAFNTDLPNGFPGISYPAYNDLAQRVREIGLRMALGLSPSNVAAWILSEGVRLVLVGLSVGIVLALGAARLVANQLLGVSAADVPTFALVAVLLLVVALLAAWLPARRAARFDPAEALRS